MNVQTICRICIGKHSGLMNIFEPYNFPELNCEIFKIITLCASVQIQESDGFSEQICLTCLEHLYQAYSFKKLCEESDYKFRNDLIVEENEIKNEFSEEDFIINYGQLNSESDENTDKMTNIVEENGGLIPSTALECKKQSSYKSQSKYGNGSVHMELHTKETPYYLRKPREIGICAKNVNLQSEPNRHYKMHKTKKLNKCEICNKLLSKKSDLVKHIIVHTGEKLFKCDICSKSFSQKSSLARHKTVHTGKRISDNCNKQFSHKTGLKHHIRVHTGEKKYKCDICDQTFSQKGDLVRHNTVHTGEKQYMCDICDKKFSYKRDLVRHIAVHMGEKQFKCDTCDKSFSRKHRLMEHIRVHTGEPVPVRHLQ